MTGGPLAGRRILVTRAAGQAESLARKLRAEGAEVISVALIALEPLAEAGSRLRAAVAALGQTGTRPTHVIFTSANTVNLVAAAVPGGAAGAVLAPLCVCAVGSQTAMALGRHEVRVDLVPATFDGEGVAATLVAAGIRGARIWIPGAEASGEVLPRRLREAGAEVMALALYRTLMPAAAPRELAAVLDSGIDVITLASGSAARHLLAALGRRPIPGETIVACIGPATAAAAAAAGLVVAVVGREHTGTGLVRALSEHFGRR